MTNEEAYEQYQANLEQIKEMYGCNCSSIRAVRRKIADGRIVVYEQCCRCGKSPKSLKKSEFDLDTLPWYDESLADRFSKNLQAFYDKARKQFNLDLEEARQTKETEIAQERAEESAQWWKTYNEYLHTQQWHDMRKRVLERDGYICQACLKNKATQAHHLSYSIYNMIGRSAAFELVAICYQCHRTIHPHMAEAQHNVNETLFNPYMIGGNNGRR